MPFQRQWEEYNSPTLPVLHMGLSYILHGIDMFPLVSSWLLDSLILDAWMKDAALKFQGNLRMNLTFRNKDKLSLPRGIEASLSCPSPPTIILFLFLFFKKKLKIVILSVSFSSKCEKKANTRKEQILLDCISIIGSLKPSATALGK
jgi:hypothetical protein